MVETVSAPADKMSQRALAALGKLPPFSPILNKLLASLGGEDVSFAKLGDLIEKDTVVAGNILHLVNSALYARRATITSVRHALALLGMDKVRNTLLGMSISRMWSQVKTPPVWSMARFNRHSAAVAVLSDHIASKVPADYPEGAFVAGLLHDLGRLLIALGLPDEFTRLVKLHEQSERSWTACERELLGFTHAELSAAALATWKFRSRSKLRCAITISRRRSNRAEACPSARWSMPPISMSIQRVNRSSPASWWAPRTREQSRPWAFRKRNWAGC
jgi:HD-like signal output (HDOD) protein